VINGKTRLLPLFGFPTDAFKAPLIYNPWFESRGIDAVVVPMGVKVEDYAGVLRSVFKLTNVPGALVTMPHKITTVGLLDEVTTAVRVAGACNAIVRRADGSLFGDIFDGTGFTRGLSRKGFAFADAKCLVVGAGGVGSAIAAALAAAGVGMIAVCDAEPACADGLVARLRQHYPALIARTGSRSAAGYDLVVNATPLGLPDDPLPIDVASLAPSTFVGEVVMKSEMTPLLVAAQRIGCRYQIGTDMLFEMIPAYLEFFGFGQTSAEELRKLATIRY
jgi:shikimate dehydrogenase